GGGGDTERAARSRAGECARQVPVTAGSCCARSREAASARLRSCGHSSDGAAGGGGVAALPARVSVVAAPRARPPEQVSGRKVNGEPYRGIGARARRELRGRGNVAPRRVVLAGSPRAPGAQAHGGLMRNTRWNQ